MSPEQFCLFETFLKEKTIKPSFYYLLTKFDKLLLLILAAATEARALGEVGHFCTIME